MKLNRNDAPIDEKARNDMNENWDIIENSFNDLTGKITNDVLDHLIDSAKLNWKEPVDSFNDLPSDAIEGDTIMTRDEGKVYRFNGKEWIEIQDVDPTIVNEFDKRINKRVDSLESDVNDRLITLDNELGAEIEEVSNVGYDTFAIWQPPVMPDTLRGNGTVPSGYDPDEHLDALIEPLVDGKYVTRTDLGLTQDEGYTIRRYDFTPKNYSKTIILTACIHGNEYTGFYALYQFLDLLVNRYQESPQLNYLRKNVRIITIPIINMWGFANQKRQNSRGVDLNRNFPLYWDGFSSNKVGDTYYKGDQPFSEAESIILDDMLKEFSDAVSHIDFHTTNVVEGEYVLYHPRYLQNNTRLFEKVANHLVKNGERIIWSASRLPEFTTHSCDRYKMNVANPEFVNGIKGGTRGSDEMTRAVRWFGNIVIQSSLLKKTSAEILDDSYMKVLKYNKKSDADAISFTNQIYHNIDPTYLSFEVRTPGILFFNGSIKFKANSYAEGKTAYFYPHMYQQDAPDFGYDDTKDDPDTPTEVYIPSEGTYTAPLNGQLFAQVSSTDRQRAGNVVFRMRAKTSGGRITVENISGRIVFIPSSNGNRYEIYDATGNESQETEAMKKIFPK